MRLNSRTLGKQRQQIESSDREQSTFMTTDGYIVRTSVDISSGQTATPEQPLTPACWFTGDQPVDNYVTTSLGSPVDLPFNAWNSFGDTFKKAMDSSDVLGQLPDYHTSTVPSQQLPISQTSWDINNWTVVNNGQIPRQQCMEPLTESYNGMQHEITGDGGDCSLSPLNVVPRQGPSNLAPSIPIKPVRKAKWGDSSGSSKRKSTSKIRYSPSDEDDRSGDQFPRKKNQLKSSRIRKGNFSNSTSSPESSPSSSNVVLNSNRTSHNLVEKQYRNRLNDQFDFLLSSIPSDLVGYHMNGPERGDRPEKRVSKADVLVLAKKHIENLEKRKRELEVENVGLKGTNKRLNEVWMSQQGNEILFNGNGH
ncbi:hypothetical protein HYALB_00009179 [Hymenoscyphus albidus]|uniref:BHLH domain-containing protein n=1 Tax=Hymenoscyphus albidus TaxID=595503 RepID=A0A9N9LW06_9HELO|nr:hypothetical protein HYALB_00009179 [Hymenoscyphus albidus]